jgi:hypothetical protein
MKWLACGLIHCNGLDLFQIIGSGRRVGGAKMEIKAEVVEDMGVSIIFRGLLYKRQTFHNSHLP